MHLSPAICLAVDNGICSIVWVVCMLVFVCPRGAPGTPRGPDCGWFFRKLAVDDATVDTRKHCAVLLAPLCSVHRQVWSRTASHGTLVLLEGSNECSQVRALGWRDVPSPTSGFCMLTSMTSKAWYCHSDFNFSPINSINAIDECFPVTLLASLRPCSDSWHSDFTLGFLRAPGPASPSALLPSPCLLQRILVERTPMDFDGNVVVGMDPTVVKSGLHRNGGHV